MTDRARTRVVAALVAFVVAGAVVAGGFALAAAVGDDHEPDGSFVLDEPGVHQQPFDDVNRDSSGDRVPDTALTDADGVVRRLSEFRGTPTVVNVWFSTCVPCRRELRDFATVDLELGGAVQFVGVNPFDDVDTMVRFAGERGVEYPLWRDVERAFSDELGIVGYPVTLFVTADGEIVRQTGELDADELREAVEELF
jgi:peroxiredoxin